LRGRYAVGLDNQDFKDNIFLSQMMVGTRIKVLIGMSLLPVNLVGNGTIRNMGD
jgi:hypothetical protein